MARILLLIAAVLLLVWLLRGIGRGDRDQPPTGRGRAERTPKAGETMVVCAHCGVHLPSGEAVRAEGLHFCGEPHRIEFERQRTQR
jgi:uncharacterized protein